MSHKASAYYQFLKFLRLEPNYSWMDWDSADKVTTMGLESLTLHLWYG